MEKKTSTGEMKIKEKNDVEWYTAAPKQPGADLLKNLAVAASLVICAVTLKTGAVPGAEHITDAVVTAVTDDTLLDDQLGKLSFVSSLFPEATLVFGEQHAADLALPVSGGTVVHAWSEEEPYMSWRVESRDVLSSGSGVVMGVYHGMEEERIVQIMCEDGLVCVYGNLEEAYVQEGDQVEAGMCIGELVKGQDCVLEVSLNGESVDPLRYIGNVQ